MSSINNINSKRKQNVCGTRQCDRFPRALSNDYVKIDERTFEDLIQQLSEYAKKVNFYNDENKEDGDWEPFFKEIYDYETHTIKTRSLQKQMSEGTVPPHLSLLLSFLKLYQVQQNNLNKITGRHLEFYYQNILGFKPRVGKVGNAVVFANLVKNTSSVILPKGTLFDAGKDSNGKTIMFESTDEVTINKAKVEDCYYSYLRSNGNYDIENIQVKSEKQDSVILWDKNSNDKTNELNLGFAISISSFLNAKNKKYIDLGLFGEKVNLEYFTVEYTSENGWESVDDKFYIFLKYIKDKEKEKALKSIREKVLPNLGKGTGHKEINYNNIKKYISGSDLGLFNDDGGKDRGQSKHYFIRIDAIMDPMVPYDPKIHGEGYNSSNPIIRFLPMKKDGTNIKDNNQSWDLYDFKKSIFKEIYLHEDQSIDNITIENKYGIVNNIAGSSPFGYMCEAKDYFLVKINIPQREFYSNLKKDTYTINLDVDGYNPEISPNGVDYMSDMEFPVVQYILGTDEHRIDKRLANYLNPTEDETGAMFKVVLKSSGAQKLQVVKLVKEITGLGLKEAKDMVDGVPSIILPDVDKTTAENTKKKFEEAGAEIEVIKNTTETTKKGTTKKETTNPYTPFELNKAISYNSDILIPTQKLELFTIAPWGINKIDLQDCTKSDSKEKDDTVDYIFQNDYFPPLRSHKRKEEFRIFFALSGISQPTCLSLYIELGKYNIDKEDIVWSYLGKTKEGKDWKEFNPMNIYKDGTNNFTKNGIVQLLLNEEVFAEHSGLDSDVIWLSVEEVKDKSRSGKLENLDESFLRNVKCIQPQAIEVAFSDRSVGSLQNEIRLPQGSITKLVKNVIGIKKIEQPYDGFIGISSETTDEFNCRVSENLRHKGKAWSSWDYERILLDKFPQLVAVKCIPCLDSNPGTVSIVVFPNVSLIPQGDNIRKPIIDAFTRSEIEDYLKTICSPFVTIVIKDPKYIEIKINCTIRLKKEFHDHEYYKKLINEELINFLAPWRVDPLNISLISHIPTVMEMKYFLEKLKYVDYIKDLNVTSMPPNSKADDATFITYSEKEFEINIINE